MLAYLIICLFVLYRLTEAKEKNNKATTLYEDDAEEMDRGLLQTSFNMVGNCYFLFV